MAVELAEETNKGLDLLNWSYQRTVEGIPKVSKPIEVLADEYVHRYKKSDLAIKKLIKNQVQKNSINGFVSGVGGAFTLPVTVAAISTNITSVIYVQMRMIAAIAYIKGYDLKDDEVQTFVYACIAGKGISDVFKEAGITTGMKMGKNIITKKIPSEVLTKINQKIGFRFITKNGTKGVINLTKLVPVVGGIIGGGFDYGTTKIIATRANKVFDSTGIINMDALD
ncbi:EcsC family protein [Lacticigenium naphthae]|uniref:EcsC family protein n=1 Tax=Lacticigenium naphthae TaxID=515351 RepID=UPI00042224A8|nr:EcsC family protein [Lacticigenium naphthae]